MTYWLMSISGFLVALAIAHIVSARRWRARIEAARKRLAGTPPGAPVSEGELPAPVAEFARRAIAGVHVALRAVTLTQRAEMRLSPAGRWFPVAASQTISIAEPGFLWLARARLLGVLPMEVIDAFVGGEGWLDRLCDTERAGQVDCQVESFRQELDAAKQLTIHYTVSGEIEDRLLPFGPLPEPDLAMCEAGGQPIVRVGSMGAVRGLDGNGDTVWNTEAFSPSEAATGQGAPITIRAARAN